MALETAAQIYLFYYNALHAIGWIGVLVGAAVAAYQGAPLPALFQIAAVPASYLQMIAVLEIVHAATGLVKSSPLNNFWQWLGRSNALFVFALRIPELQQSVWALVMVLVWATGEAIRYPWYAASLAEDCPGWLTWLRYTAFIGLYPLGVVSEMYLLWKGIPTVREEGIFTIRMPNTWNFGWDHALFVQIMLFAYPLLWWRNYSSLLRQRKKKLGKQGEAAAADAKTTKQE